MVETTWMKAYHLVITIYPRHPSMMNCMVPLIVRWCCHSYYINWFVCQEISCSWHEMHSNQNPSFDTLRGILQRKWWKALISTVMNLLSNINVIKDSINYLVWNSISMIHKIYEIEDVLCSHTECPILMMESLIKLKSILPWQKFQSVNN